MSHSKQWLMAKFHTRLYSGRKKLCLVFCVSYTLTCACILFPVFPILLLGRVLGGISTSILYSAFESWLISSSTSLALASSDLSLIMGRATLLNGFVATTAGVVSNQLVANTKSFATPFIASAVLLIFGYVVIRGTWIENYGGGGGVSLGADPLQLKRLGQAWRIVRDGTRQ
jgi:MFS transporter, MFS domain-containing protein family, molybdate-anion transporter